MESVKNAPIIKRWAKKTLPTLHFDLCITMIAKAWEREQIPVVIYLEIDAECFVKLGQMLQIFHLWVG
jgi:hypothetical protein